MKMNLVKIFNLAIGIGAGTAIYQYLFTSEQPFDFYRPIFVAVFSIVILCFYSAVKGQNNN